MAIALGEVQATCAALRAAGVACQPPCRLMLPGTPITEGLAIMFIRDPDDVIVELVERPRSHLRS